MIKILANKRRSSEPISLRKSKVIKMSNFPLTSFAIELVTKSSLSNMAGEGDTGKPGEFTQLVLDTEKYLNDLDKDKTTADENEKEVSENDGELNKNERGNKNSEASSVRFRC